MNADEIVREITQRAWRFGVAVLLSPDTNVDCDGNKVQGFFTEEEPFPRMVVGTGAEEQLWLGCLLHEYCHLTQWVEQTPLWLADGKSDNIDEWLAGKAIRCPRKAISLRREMEADCERRTVRLIQELQAPINLPHYIRAANSYIHFHNVMADKRKWYRADRTPYKTPEVTMLANPTLDADFSKTPPALRAALLTCI